jgi:hypothetical protein
MRVVRKGRISVPIRLLLSYPKRITEIGPLGLASARNPAEPLQL